MHISLIKPSFIAIFCTTWLRNSRIRCLLLTLIRYKDSASQKFRRDNGALPYVVRLHFKMIQCDFNDVKLFSIIKIQNNSCHQRMEVSFWFRFLNWKIISNYFWNAIWQKNAAWANEWTTWMISSVTTWTLKCSFVVFFLIIIE